jgi:N-acetylmuramoyl-L-alanine amidase
LRVSSKIWFPAVVLTAGLLLGSAALAAPSRATPSRSTGGAYVQIQGIQYVSAAEFARKLDLKSAWVKTGRRLAMTGDSARVEIEVDAREAQVNGVRVFLGEPPRMYRRSLYISRADADRFLGPILDPRYQRPPLKPVKIIALDAGHGGRDTGKINNKLKVQEKTFALDVVLRSKHILENAGYKVVLTRSDDRFVELEDRPAIAQKAGADVFVSVHFNSVEKRPEQVTGVEVFTMVPQYQYSTDDYMRRGSEEAKIFNPGNTNDGWNALLAHRIHRQMINDLRVPDRGHKRQRFKVLRLALCPAVLVEAGYLSNDAEAEKIASAEYRQQLAESLSRGIVSYARAVQNAR